MASFAPAIRHRFAATKSTIQALRKSLYIDSHAYLDYRVIANIVHMYVFSKACFDSGLWPLFSVLEKRSVHTHVMKAYKNILCVDGFNFKYDDDDDVLCLIDCQLMVPNAFISFTRISMLARLIAKQQWTILILCHVARIRPKSWADAVLCDLQAMAGMIPEFYMCQCGDLARWTQLMQDAPKCFIKKVHVAG